MRNPPRPLPFVLAATEQGTLIVNRLDYRMVDQNRDYGVGFNLLNSAAFDPDEIDLAAQLLALQRRVRGDGVVALDCGANIGVHTVNWARQMTGWGEVLAIEAQERIFYALAGNICLSNCFNARAVHGAIADTVGTLSIPVPDYRRPSSFGSLELQLKPNNENIGQVINYAAASLQPIRQFTIDSLELRRLDFIKLDIEGMEEAALTGAHETLRQHKPLILVEYIKSGSAPLTERLGVLGYDCHTVGMNLLAVHRDDPAARQIHFGPPSQPDRTRAARRTDPTGLTPPAGVPA